MKAGHPIHAFRTMEKPMSRLACFPLILLLVLAACSKPVSNTGDPRSQGAGNAGASTPAGNACDRKLVTSADAAAILGEPIASEKALPGDAQSCVFTAADFTALTISLSNGGYLGCGEDAHAGDQRIRRRRTGGVAVDAQGDHRGKEQPALRHRGRRSRPGRGRDTGDTRRPLQQDFRGDVRLQPLTAKPKVSRRAGAGGRTKTMTLNPGEHP
jgi:hypothetical protein